MPNIASIMRDHVTLSIDCMDRIYVNGYQPKLQTPGQLCYFLSEHLGKPIPSPALFPPLRERFVGSIRRYVEEHEIPVVHFERFQKKDDVLREYRRRFSASEGVVVLGVAQERCWSFKATKRRDGRASVSFDFSRQPVYVNQYYFYFQDQEWGPGFLKISSYLPYPVKLCLNGHEWAKQQLRREGIGFESLDNGFLCCEEPQRLQELCEQLGEEDVQRCFDRWSQRLPWPLLEEDRAAGYEHRLSIWQLEESRTQVFDRPLRGRQFFEQVIREHLDLGRPDRVSLVFDRRLSRRTPAPRSGYRTRVLTTGVQPSLHIDYKHSHVKQYFKEGRALRTETTINDPRDFGVNKGLSNLGYLRHLGRSINHRLLEAEQLSQDCLVSESTFDRLQRPSIEGGQRASAMRFGDHRVQALLESLCRFSHLPAGFRNRDLRPQVAALLADPLYGPGQMTYDLRRLRRKGVISRLEGTHRYILTTYGLRIALFFTKLSKRLFEPARAAFNEGSSSLSHRLGQAFRRVDTEIRRLYRAAKLDSAEKLDPSVTKLNFGSA